MATDDDDDDGMAAEILAEPFVQATIEKTLATYRGIVPEHMLRTLREILEDTMTTNPYAVGLIRQLKARRAPASSGEVVREDAPANGVRHGTTGGGRQGA